MPVHMHKWKPWTSARKNGMQMSSGMPITLCLCLFPCPFSRVTVNQLFEIMSFALLTTAAPNEATDSAATN